MGILRDLDVADEDQLDLFDTLDVDGGGTIDLEELITGIAKLRGDARRSDIIGVGLIVRAVQLTMNDFYANVMDMLNAHGELLRSGGGVGTSSEVSVNAPLASADLGCAWSF